MADQLKKIVDGTLLAVTTVVALRLASIAGSPNNERLTIKRLIVTNVGAVGGQTATITLWRGSAQDNAHMFKNAVPLAPGEQLEFDPTTMVLEPGDTLWAQASIANLLSVQADGLRQTE